jgi:hypothetical protein
MEMKKMKMKCLAALFTCFLILGLTGVSNATYIVFDPGDDSGDIYGYYMNPGSYFASGYGMLFDMSKDVTIDSLGINIALVAPTVVSYEITEWTSTGTMSAILRSGSETMSTTGLEWVDFSFDDLTLNDGGIYHFKVSHNGLVFQAFFFKQDSTFSIDGFNLIDGTYAYNTSNYVLAPFRVNAVPLPAAISLFVSGLFSLAFLKRRRNLRLL